MSLSQNVDHLRVLRQGTSVWNQWRLDNPDVRQPFLSQADLSGADLRQADLSGAQLFGADLSGASLRKADLTGAQLPSTQLLGADLSGASLRKADLTGAQLPSTQLLGADLTRADLSGASLRKADLTGADLTGADLTGADLNYAILVHTNLDGAILTGCRIYGTSVWDLKLDEHTVQRNLIITPPFDPEIQVDNIEIAQFVYLLLSNAKLRDVIDTIGKKAVLILGRFSKKRKAVLDALRDALRERGYVPILFDFERPSNRDLTETVSILAHLSRFIIADLTDAKSLPQELSHVVPFLPSVPVQPLLLAGDREYGMFEHFQRYPWVLPIHRYEDQTALLEALDDVVIAPVESRADELAPTQGGQ